MRLRRLLEANQPWDFHSALNVPQLVAHSVLQIDRSTKDLP
jgi:hypothetical protein